MLRSCLLRRVMASAESVSPDELWRNTGDGRLYFGRNVAPLSGPWQSGWGVGSEA
jgi:hypothetical protein